jgi:hypothetical protein
MRIKALHTIILKNMPIYPGEEATVATDMGQDLINREYATPGAAKKKADVPKRNKEEKKEVKGEDKPQL